MLAHRNGGSEWPVEVQLFPNDNWRDKARDDSTDARGFLAFPNLAPGPYSGIARHVGKKQQLFRLWITAGFVDTLELELGRSGP